MHQFICKCGKKCTCGTYNGIPNGLTVDGQLVCPECHEKEFGKSIIKSKLPNVFERRLRGIF